MTVGAPVLGLGPSPTERYGGKWATQWFPSDDTHVELPSPGRDA